MCLLKNRRQCPKYLVETTMTFLQHISKNPTLFFDVIQKCKDPRYNYPNDVSLMDRKERIGILQALQFVDKDGNIPENIRNIVLSAITEEDFSSLLHDPIEKD